MFKLFLGILLITLTLTVHAGVSLKNGNFFISYTDIVVPGGGKELEITRTYNSKSTEIGWFGFGWGSEFETKLVVSSDGAIVIHENGSGAKTRFTPEKPIDVVAGSKRIIEEMKKKTPLSENAEKDLLQKLTVNAELRHNYAQRLGVRVEIPEGTVLYSKHRGPQELLVTAKGFKRKFADGREDTFDKGGRLERIQDKTGYYIAFVYKDGNLESIKDSQAKQIFFSWYPNGMIKELWSAGDKKANYRYNGEDLVYSKDVKENAYEYAYDVNHNMTAITYSDKTKQVIAYDPKTFFVVSIMDKNGELTKYKYESNPSTPDDHYWTIVTKKGFDGKEVDNRYEYETKLTPDGRRYTHKLITIVSNVKTETIYNEISLPLKIARGNLVTNFEYNQDGLLTNKSSSDGTFAKINYHPRFKKITKVINNDGTTEFEYDDKENLVKASTDKGKMIFLIYDTKGKISKMVDQDSPKERKVLSFVYNAMGKPVEIQMENVGKLNVAYDNYGEIKKVDSSTGAGKGASGAGNQIGLEITRSFQNLLAIVKPSGVDLNI